MRIKPFEDHKDNLFTDYVLQIFNAHTSEDNHEVLEALMESFSGEAYDQKSFFPGIIFGAMVHMLMMMQIISKEKMCSMDESMKEYNSLYNENRNALSRMLGNRPEYAEEMVKKFMEQMGKDTE
jgi:hypothetical protein